MKIFVKAKPNAKNETVEQIDNGHFVISVKEPPVKGMANRAIIKAIARHFNVSESNVRLVFGFSSREKIFEIN
ncbi:MAG: DUF167 domain-containing protein [Candidatus Staskawiczbacteria bacterium]|nr:DUF167 domain-containing protein [Candidatus Staskawiczbacteria bacterium]